MIRLVGLLVVIGVLVVGVVFGVVSRVRNGRVRVTEQKPERALPEPVGALLDPASDVTLVQISTTFCAPCWHAKAVLSALADKTDGLRHVDLDVTEQPEVAQALGILRTPTTLALTSDGRELLRVGGVPKGSALLEALRPHLPQLTSALPDPGNRPKE
jgi:thiol-disulfide isomerase/thioredoxin